MTALSSYYRLIRAHKPAGFLLLWFPTAWALWVANQGFPPFVLTIKFILGTFIMRSAGCIINDISDRNIDNQVSRTKSRPLAAGEISVIQACFFCLLLLVIALLILLSLPAACIPYALIALAITGIYPLCKRFFHAPQLVLGLAFSMGILIAYKASYMPFNSQMGLIFFINFLWIVSYDTVYAMADLADDIRINVKSTARLFSPYTINIIIIIQGILHLLWLLLIPNANNPALFIVCWLLGIIIFIVHYRTLQEKQYITAFSINVWYGLIMWLAWL